jgi:uncharacterized membrane protein
MDDFPEQSDGRFGLRRLERALGIVLLIAAADTIYLSWRFAALFFGWVEPGTGICSWTQGIDCDRVLKTPEARAFVVPNAILGLGFYTGAAIWWFRGRRLGEEYRRHLVRTLAVWLGVASFFTFWFWWLLLHLPALCPFCPWNHVLTYLALVLAVLIQKRTPRPRAHPPWPAILRLVALCVLWFFSWQGLWFLAEATILKRSS